MTGRPDPLAVLDEAQRVLGEVHFKYQIKIGPFATQALRSVHALPKARADVAALVEAAREVVQADRDGELTDAMTNKLAAALAPFGDRS